MNKVVVITGGSDGIGKAIAKRVATQNKVIIVSHNEDKTKKAAEELGCEYEVADVSKWDELNGAVENIVKKHGQIDVFVNNAGVWIEGKIDENDPEEIAKTVNVNVTGVMLGTRAIVPVMKKQGKGLIVNISSQAGLYAKPERSVYNATKWAVTGFTKSLQAELGEFNIKVSGVYPGYIDTQLFEKVNITKDASKAIGPDDVAKIVELMVEADDNFFIPEVGMKSIKG